MDSGLEGMGTFLPCLRISSRFSVQPHEESAEIIVDRVLE